jgi:pimeloyl-ACP methyl ester carboxylesterase
MEKAMFKSEYGDIYYELSRAKEKPVIIFTHGVGMDHRTFATQVEAFKADYGVLVWDLPGHGRSTIKKRKERFTKMSADCLNRLMDELGIDEAILVGQSLGSMIVQHFQILITYLEKDLFFIRNAAKKWHRTEAGSQCVEIPNANHIANQDNPEAFNQAVMDFLGALEEKRGR